MSDKLEEPETPKEETPKVEIKGLSEEQVNELLNKARQQEKDKLYPQIEELGTTVKSLQEQLREQSEEKAKVEAEAKKKAEDERQAQLSAEERLAETMSKIEEQLASERRAREELETKIAQAKRSEELAAYRSQKIAEAKGEIVADLVRGNSEAEVDATFETAKARYTEIVEQVKKERADGVKTNMPGPANPDTAAREEAELLNSITNIEVDTARYAKDKEYAAEMDKKRAAVHEQLAQAYAREVGVV